MRKHPLVAGKLFSSLIFVLCGTASPTIAAPYLGVTFEQNQGFLLHETGSVPAFSYSSGSRLLYDRNVALWGIEAGFPVWKLLLKGSWKTTGGTRAAGTFQDTDFFLFANFSEDKGPSLDLSQGTIRTSATRLSGISKTYESFSPVSMKENRWQIGAEIEISEDWTFGLAFRQKSTAFEDHASIGLNYRDPLFPYRGVTFLPIPAVSYAFLTYEIDFSLRYSHAFGLFVPFFEFKPILAYINSIDHHWLRSIVFVSRGEGGGFGAHLGADVLLGERFRLSTSYAAEQLMFDHVNVQIKMPLFSAPQVGNGDHIVIKDHAYRLSLQILL